MTTYIYENLWRIESLIKCMNKVDQVHTIKWTLDGCQHLEHETQETLKQLCIYSKRVWDGLLVELKEMRCPYFGTLIHKAKSEKSPGANNLVREDSSGRVWVSDKSGNSEFNSWNDDDKLHASRCDNAQCNHAVLKSYRVKLTNSVRSIVRGLWKLVRFHWSYQQLWMVWQIMCSAFLGSYLSDSAKSIWQRTLKLTDNSSYNSIVLVF